VCLDLFVFSNCILLRLENEELLQRGIAVHCICSRDGERSACSQHVGYNWQPLAQWQRHVRAAQNVIRSAGHSVCPREHEVGRGDVEARDARHWHCRDYQKWPDCRAGSKVLRIEGETNFRISCGEEQINLPASGQTADKGRWQPELETVGKIDSCIGKYAEALVGAGVQQSRLVVVTNAIRRWGIGHAGAFRPSVIGYPANLKRAFVTVENRLGGLPHFREDQPRAADHPIVQSKHRIKTRHHGRRVEPHESIERAIGGAGSVCCVYPGNRQRACGSVIQRRCVGADK